MNETLFVKNWIDKILSEGIKNFPLDFIDKDALTPISIPLKTLVIGNDFFGSVEVITTTGEQVYQAASHNEAKFIVYASKERNGLTYLPADKTKIPQCVELYDAYLDELLTKIKKDYTKTFPDGKNLLSLSNQIFQKLNLIRY